MKVQETRSSFSTKRAFLFGKKYNHITIKLIL